MKPPKKCKPLDFIDFLALASILAVQHKNESTSKEVLFSFLERCVPQAERDAHFVRDDGFAK